MTLTQTQKPEWRIYRPTRCDVQTSEQKLPLKEKTDRHQRVNRVRGVSQSAATELKTKNFSLFYFVKCDGLITRRFCFTSSVRICVTPM